MLPRLPQFKSVTATRRRAQTWTRKMDTLVIEHEDGTTMTDHLIHTKHKPRRHRNSHVETPAVRIYQVDREGVALQIRNTYEYSHINLTPDELRAILLAGSHVLANWDPPLTDPRPDPLTLTEFHD